MLGVRFQDAAKKDVRFGGMLRQEPHTPYLRTLVPMLTPGTVVLN